MADFHIIFFFGGANLGVIFVEFLTISLFHVGVVNLWSQLVTVLGVKSFENGNLTNR